VQRRQSRLVLLDQLVGVGKCEVVVGIDIEPPEQLLFPRRQRAGPHRFDVGERQEAQHLQHLLGADDAGEAPGDIRILRVAPEGGMRHHQMVADQERDGVARLGGQLQPIKHPLRQPHALQRMLLVLPLADVVVEQRQREQLRRVQLAENAAEARAAGGGRLEQRLDVAEGEERVLVNRVLVVEVANHPAVDQIELGEDPAELTAVVHLRQACVEPRPGPQQVADAIPGPDRVVLRRLGLVAAGRRAGHDAPR
jgi:hypothetical protein